jgi:hypothetical protein
MKSTRAGFGIGRWCAVSLPLVLCGLPGVAGAQPAADASMSSDELLTAQNLSKIITSNQWYAIGAAVLVVALLLGIAYLVPLIRAPRWQILGFAVVPVLVALVTMAALSRPLEPDLQGITREEMENVVKSEVTEVGDKALAKKILKWQGEIEGRSFLIGVSTKPMSAAFGLSAALMMVVWLLSHRRVLRAN